MTRGRQGQLRSRWHALLHGLIIVTGWLGFGWLWWRVGQHSWDSRDLRQLVLAAALLFPILTGSWVLHNLRIYRRLGPRRSVRAVAYASQDIHGRPVSADWSQVRTARDVVIDCDGAVKLYGVAVPA